MMKRARTAEAILWTTVAIALSACPTTTTTTTTTSTTSTTSSTVTTTTLPSDHTAPSTPGGVSASPTSCSQITLAWSPATDTGGSGLRGYNVHRGGVFLRQVVGATTTLDGGLAAGTVYAYTVSAVDGAGNVSAPSATATANTPACPDTTPPSTPSGLSATGHGCGQIDLAWNAASDAGGSGLRGYNIYRNGALLRLVPTPATSMSDAGLAASTAYAYTATAVDNAGNASAPSAAASATTPACASLDLTGFVPGVGTPYDVAVDAATGLAYVASREFGLSVVDATSPSAPVTVGAANPPFYGQRIAVAGSLAVVGGRSLGMRVVDVTTPSAPRTVGELGGDVPAVALAGQTAYVLLTVAGNPAHTDLAVVSLAAPSSPAIVGRVTVGSLASDLRLAGSLAYVAAGDGGMSIVDVSNPAAPVVVGAVDTPGTASGVAVAGGYAYLADGSAVRVVDVTNPTRPVVAATLVTSATAVALAGSRLYAVDGLQVKTVDVSAPAAPVLLGSASAYGASRLDVDGPVAFLASSNVTPTQGGLYVWNVAPVAPALLANVNDTFDSRGVAVAGSLAVAAGSSRGMKVVDLADPQKPRVVGTVAGTSVAVALAGQTAYTLLLVPGNPSHVDVAAVSVGAQAAPAIIGRLTLGSGGSVTGSDARLVGSLLYVAASMPRLHVVSVASPTAPTLVGMVDLPGTASSVAVAGRYAYVAAGATIQVIDVATPSRPVVVGSLATSASALAFAGNRLYAVDATQLKVVDVTAPTAPTLLSATSGYGALGIGVAGTTVYLATPGVGHADGSEGVRAIDVSNLLAPQLLGRLVVPGAARAVTTGAGVVYAGEANGIVDVIDVGP